MKILIFLFSIFIPLMVKAETATWDQSEGATGYYLYIEKDDYKKFYRIDGGDNTRKEFFIAPGNYDFSVAAFNSIGVSDRSEIVNYTVNEYIPLEPDEPEEVEKPQKPTGLELIKIGLAMIWQGLREII